MKYKRQAALATAVLLLLLYASSIVFALIDSPLAQSLLMASVFCTIVPPALFYGFNIFARYTRERSMRGHNDEKSSQAEEEPEKEEEK